MSGKVKSNKQGIYIGIYHGHNATVAVVNDNGEVIEVVSEERFCNQKNFFGFPKLSLEYVLKTYKTSQIKGVGLPFNGLNPIYISSAGSINKYITILINVLTQVRFVLLLTNRSFYNFLYSVYNKYIGSYSILKQRQYISSLLNIDIGKVKDFNHQLCHAYCAYYLSPFNKENALVLTLDGEGDGLCATVNTVLNGEFNTIAKTPLGNSLGWMYMNLTEFMGMKANEHEYKIMGLAPYAKEEHAQVIFNKIKDWITVEGLVFKSKFDTHLTFHYLKKELSYIRFDNLAAGFQMLLEERVAEWVNNCVAETGLATVCGGGGVFMNVKANMTVSKLNAVEKMWIMPSGGDESSPIGAALLSYKDDLLEAQQDFVVAPLKTLYLGPSYTNAQIATFIKKHKIASKYNVSFESNIEKKIAKLLASGEIVANLSGRMEWGARALGNRSILADPSKPDVIREINEYVKNRDFWMPFAGSIIEERSQDYIINPKNIASDYMVMAFESTDLAKSELRSAMHPYDFTIRPQLVRKNWNPRYHKILKEFEKITGIGGVLNTSFNLHGYPIVLGPKEALFVFENCDIRYLVLENYIISKDPS